MQRCHVDPRPDYGRKLESIGLSFYNWDQYWNESICYRFNATQIDDLEAATETLHQMTQEALAFLVHENRLGDVGIPEALHSWIGRSLKASDFSIYGRFDLVYDGVHPPKLLEYNADTPTSLLESAVAQWQWLEEKFPKEDQFNSLHDKLIEHWRSLPGYSPVHFASISENEEDWVATTYLMETLIQAGRAGKHLFIEEIGWCSERNTFVDLKGREIEYLFKLYPWEWLMREAFSEHLPHGKTRWIEPPWKSVLSSKGLLPVLWTLFPDHPLLLPAFFEPNKLESYARKPLFSREGANVTLVENGRTIAADEGPYGEEGYIYQQLHLPPCFEGHYPVLGSWVVNGQAAGICIREDVQPITTNMSQFVPHYFTKD